MGLSRDIHPDTLAALTSGSFHPVTIAEVDWPGGMVRVHSGIGTLEWDGEEWLGVGHFGGIRLPSEGPGMAMVEGQLTIGAADPDGIDDYLAQAAEARGRSIRVWFGCVTTRSGTVLIGAPFQVFFGRIGAVVDEETWEGETSTRVIQIAITSGPPQRANSAQHHSYQDQMRHDPTDTAGRWVEGALARTTANVPRW